MAPGQREKVNRFLMKRLTLITFILAVQIFSLSISLYGEERRRDFSGKVVLLTPSRNEKIRGGRLVFRWRVEISDSSFSGVKEYEVVFESPRLNFLRRFKVVSQDSLKNESILEFKECRDIFRRHGRYYWKVIAFDDMGRKIKSERREFVIESRVTYRRRGTWIYPYLFQFQYVQIVPTDELKDFLKDLRSKEQFEDYFNAGIVIRQEVLSRCSFEFQERFFILSHFGLGFEASTRMRLFNTVYFSIYPRVAGESIWFSTGIRRYSNHLYSLRIGGDCTINPNKSITLIGSWIPAYRIRYEKKGDNLCTFMGKGWEFGVRLIIPESMIETFRFLGVEIDFRRIPLEFRFAKIQDSYTGTTVEMRYFSIKYVIM